MVSFKTNQTIKQFTAKNNKKIVLRTVGWKDLDQLLNFINTLVEENTFILTAKKKTKKDEKRWLKSLIKDMKNGSKIGIVAEVNKKIVGNCSLRHHSERSPHVGYLAIAILKEYRKLGIGSKMMEVLIKLGKKMKFKFLILDVFSNNKIAIDLYKRFGFKKVAKIPKLFLYKGKYTDNLTLMKKLK